MADKSFLGDKKDKEWWSNFWYYYKFRISLIAFFVILIAFGVNQCVHNVIPDLSVTYAGHDYINDTKVSELKDMFSKYVTDLDRKKGSYIELTQMPTNSNPDTKGAGVTSSQQLMLEMAAGESYLYILDRNTFNMYANQKVFLDISDITGGNKPTYGIPVSQIKGLQGYGLSPDLYLAVRTVVKDRKGKPFETQKQENARKVLKGIYK